MSSRLPRVVIVGSPNVGKSTLLNRIRGSRVSIVEPTAGVTRDRVSVVARVPTPWGERSVELVDTGGVGIVDRDDLGGHVEEQIRAALIACDLVLFVVDVRDGPSPLDHEVARRLRGFAKPVLLVVNKVESEKLRWDVEAFHALGVGEGPFAISAQNGVGLDELYEAMASRLPPPAEDELPPVPALKIAVVGRRNAGKSTLVNRLAREERVIVSEVPGTTRDALDVLIERDGETFCLIDTAGVRKKKHHEDAVEFFSDARSHKAIRRADVVIVLFDATQELSSIEKKLVRYTLDRHKVLLLGANKWDLVGDATPEEFERYLERELPGLTHLPVSFLSARTGFQVGGTFRMARRLVEASQRRVTTGELNRVLHKALESRSPSSKGHLVRLRYATQTDVAPPTFVLFLNDKQLVGKSYIRYLENRIRGELGFAQVPVRIILRDGKDAALPEPS